MQPQPELASEPQSQPQPELEYRQSKNAIIISYVCYRWFLALLTYGILAVYDYLRYRNTRLIFREKFLVFETGAFTIRSKEIPYEDILNVRAEQSLIGRWFEYGTVAVIMRYGADTIVFKYVHEPEALRKAIQSRFVASSKHKLV